MKLFLVLLFFSTTGFAQQVCLNVPSAFSPDTEITTNFDGSVNVDKIKLAYKNSYYAVGSIYTTDAQQTIIAATGICKILDPTKTYISHNIYFQDLKYDDHIQIDSYGKFIKFDPAAGQGYASQANPVIKSVVCR